MIILNDPLLFLKGSGRNPRRQIKKMKAKARDYLGYAGYDSSEEFGSSPYVRYKYRSFIFDFTLTLLVRGKTLPKFAVEHLVGYKIEIIVSFRPRRSPRHMDLDLTVQPEILLIITPPVFKGD